MIYQEAEYLPISMFILFGLNFYIQIWILSASWEQGVRPESRISTGGCCSAENSAPPSIAMQQVNVHTSELQVNYKWTTGEMQVKLDFIQLSNTQIEVIKLRIWLTCCQDHILTENIWFVWSKTSYSRDERRCYRCGTNKQQTVNIELLSQWKLEAEFHKNESGWSSSQCACTLGLLRFSSSS